MLCTVISGPDLKKALEQVELGKVNSDLFELRVDLLEGCSLKELEELYRACKKSVILTFRSQLPSDFQRLIELQPDYVDLDHHFDVALFDRIKEFSPETKTIRSWHSTDTFPDHLENLFHDLKEPAVDLVKICPTVQKTTEALELLSFQKKHPGEVIAVAMGEKSKPVRILNVKFGSPLSYAAPSTEFRAAEGQLTVGEMVDLYAFDSITEKTKIFGLIGSPLSKSCGDIAHNRAFNAFGVDGVYLKFEIEDKELPLFFEQADELMFEGLSVTMPLKEKVQPFLTEIDPTAVEIGAVNTLYRKEGKWFGLNSDGEGAKIALQKKRELQDQSVAILGAGGAARALAYKFKQAGAEVSIYNRTYSRGEVLAKEMGVKAKQADELKDYDILVNCTPLSMPVESDQLYSEAVIMDTNVRPFQSELIKAAEDEGLEVVFGFEMFVEQAVLQWDAWFSKPFNRESLRSLLAQVCEECLLQNTPIML